MRGAHTRRSPCKAPQTRNSRRLDGGGTDDDYKGKEPVRVKRTLECTLAAYIIPSLGGLLGTCPRVEPDKPRLGGLGGRDAQSVQLL